MSTPLQELLALRKKQLQKTVNSKKITTVTVGGYMSNPEKAREDYEMVDYLMQECKEYINRDYANWYRKCFNRIGLIKTMEILSQVKQADGIQDKKRLFASIVKKYNRWLA